MRSKTRFMDKILMTSQVFSGKNMEVKLAMCIQAINISIKGRDLLQRYDKIRLFDALERQTM